MKKLLLAVFISVALIFGASSQTQITVDPLTIKIESTRVIGDYLLVSGKLTTSSGVRLMGIEASAVTQDGDAQPCKALWWAGKSAYLSSWDNTLLPDIPYSFDLAIKTDNKNMNPITALIIKFFNHTTQQRMQIVMKNIAVPLKADPNLASASVMEIYKDVYLKWTKAEESATALKINFVVENKANKDQEVSFYSYNEATIIDNEGNAHKAPITLRNAVNFPTNTPIAGSITTKTPLKMSQVVMVQFSSGDYKYDVKKLVFSQK
ncbi:hypothetical protein [Dysgonomonas sp. 520]|uniref:hypothetical protein n=1 Tax=Dysgonomonas sp. 520 TaxID=2302931 RepID=UPI0013D45D03|nr:hypothetical protein [Dysgonomonas sp. 520]NDW09028.1 hypothetical protein [Dysgonomonas sp. 520]